MKTASIPSSGLHHVAFGTRNPEATYDFYHDRLGMPLIHTENHRLEDGYFRHFFFDMGEEQYLGFFEFENIGEKKDYKTDISFSLGLPGFINHVAFKISDEQRFEAIKQQLQDNGVAIAAEVDHEWCKSIYLADPNLIMVEFCMTYDKKKFSQNPKQAYDLLFNTPAEDIGEASRKSKGTVTQ